MEVDARTDPKSGAERPLDENEFEAVIEKLNAEGVQTFQGRPWTADNVKKVLQRLRAKR